MYLAWAKPFYSILTTPERFSEKRLCHHVTIDTTWTLYSCSPWHINGRSHGSFVKRAGNNVGTSHAY